MLSSANKGEDAFKGTSIKNLPSINEQSLEDDSSQKLHIADRDRQSCASPPHERTEIHDKVSHTTAPFLYKPGRSQSKDSPQGYDGIAWSMTHKENE